MGNITDSTNSTMNLVNSTDFDLDAQSQNATDSEYATNSQLNELEYNWIKISSALARSKTSLPTLISIFLKIMSLQFYRFAEKISFVSIRYGDLLDCPFHVGFLDPTLR